MQAENKMMKNKKINSLKRWATGLGPKANERSSGSFPSCHPLRVFGNQESERKRRENIENEGKKKGPVYFLSK